jgi:hypothetical protein
LGLNNFLHALSSYHQLTLNYENFDDNSNYSNVVVDNPFESFALAADFAVVWHKKGVDDSEADIDNVHCVDYTLDHDSSVVLLLEQPIAVH